MMKTSTRNYWLLSTALFAFFLTWSFAFSLFPIWLNRIVGLGGEQTGVIFSINALAALLVMPCYGYLQDKLQLRKNLLYTVGFLLLGSGPFFIFVYAPLLQAQFYLGVSIGACYFALAFMSGVGALETYIDRCGRLTGFEFGKARMWGSLGWACATFFAGSLININPDINFWLASSSALIFCLAILMVKAPEKVEAKLENQERVQMRDAMALLKLPTFWAFATYVMGVTCVYSVYDQQFPVYFASLFDNMAEGTAMFGYLNSVQVFLEAGGMFVAPFIVNRIGAKNGLLLAGVIMAVRILGSGVASDPISISVIKLLHAAELPIMLVAIFKYIARNFDPRLSSTLYLVGFQFTTQVAASGLSVIAGMMYDRIGFANAYFVLGAVVVIFLAISALALCNDRDAEFDGLAVAKPAG
ncbi:MFS transporter [Microbulbifer rhizosphaerae]|uniref:OHS family lactose permease-like MFS transporter n=1 Tax=Microbulbifer rhizosphaerae TaxID=1562603 RepID=A0A7W4ZBH5_9GAMM|nr:MFS transporter [Microbulbifer rhizosphaerae]MBB3062305.1 OHS family lactose permease-like MFS transporter [Microbulbifer rhizosphaerae]